jgi:serine/threonine protein kinase
LAEVDVDPISGRKIINHYEIISELGRGVHGKVKLGRNLLTDSFVAIKIVERVSKRPRLGRTDNQEAKVKREIAILKKARHPNIVGLLEVIDDPTRKKVYIVLEHAELGEVEWRTRGEVEICLIEYRRNQRESEGVFENEAENQHDQHILETAHRNLERQERRELAETQRRYDQGLASNVGPWSLEHGADSDAEPQSPVGGRYAPTANPLRASVVTTVLRREYADTPPQIQDRPDVTHHSAFFERPEPPFERSQSPERPHYDALSTAEIQADLEGTMYGPYGTASPQDHTPSAFDSFASSRDDHFENRIPEHYSYVPTMSLAETRRAIRDTVLGLEYLHYQGVVHRDIKPANLLQTKDHRVKISDFGVSYLGKTAGDQPEDPTDTDNHHYDEALELAKTVGTPAFYAPELCRLDMDENDPPPVTNQIDVWAVGVTLYCLIFGRVPFHHDNTFALMRLIAEREVFIPQKRLKAVEYPREGLQSPATQNRQMANCNKRAPHELEYEDVTDDLRDLLVRLLTKDPRKRIKLAEVKHHPWLLAGIQDPARWLDESDPSTLTQGKKIEVSKEDVDVAVVSLGFTETVRDGISRVARKIGSVFSGKGTSRRRAKSSAAGTGPSSNASSSSTISQDARRQEARRQSLRPDEALFSALKASREGDHPLSRSVTASPEPREHSPFFTSSSRPESPIGFEHYPIGALGRPDMMERGMSATGSIRTIRQSDIAAMGHNGASTDPAMPSTPSMEHPPSGISGIFGGAKRKGLMSLRGKRGESSRDRQGNTNTFLPLGHEDTHAQPSVAVSQAMAAGLVNPPAALQDGVLAGGSAAPSPTSSRAPSIGGIHDLIRTVDKNGQISRASSLSSVSSRGRLTMGGKYHPYKAHPTTVVTEATGPEFQAANPSQPRLDTEIIETAKKEQFRRLINEERQHQESVLSTQQSPISHQPYQPCPPSPDDLDFNRRQAEVAPIAHEDLSLPEPASDYGLTQNTRLITSESEDQFPSGISQSTSNPSIPSAFSANSSIGTEDMAFGVESSRKAAAEWSAAQSQQHQTHFSDLPAHDEESYTMNHDDAGYSSEDDFVEMFSSKKKTPIPTRHGRSNSQPVAPAVTRQSMDISPGTTPKATDKRLSTNTMTHAIGPTDTPTEGQ